MNQKKTPAKSPDDEYVDAAVLHRQLLEEGDRKGSNAAHDRLIFAMREIRARADRGRNFLLNLLTHSDENVRLWSASHLLPLEEKTALIELGRLAGGAESWVVRSSADVTATEWRKGTLDIDWFERKHDV